MGLIQSVQITPQETDHGEEKTLKNGESNGHVISDLDLTDAVSAPEQEMPAKEEPPHPIETSKFFKNMFKKKAEAEAPAVEASGSSEPQIIAVVQTDSQKSEPPDIKGSTQAKKEPQGEPSNPSAAEVAEDIVQPDNTSPEEKSVMNFLKTFKVSPTKTSKEATVTPDVSKEQKVCPPPQGANVQEASKVLPPPPPAPPKMEGKAEIAIKKEETPPADATAVAAGGKEPAGASKAKAKDSPFGKLFRAKPVVKETEQAVEVDASKTSTLEATAKPEQPPAPKPEEQKPEKKPSPFAKLLKPKVLLGQVGSKIQAAASTAAASVSLGTRGAATESKKEGPAAPAAAEVSSGVKAKEEPKAATATLAVPAPDNKSLGSADNSSPSIPRKIEKRNSFQLFFKTLGQKQHSDAGVQTEPVAPEKTK
ncbi:breast carcinoma-amplified sequence 1 isoform X2 [Brachyhypopomus gauderio]|uniref:breast carcinoma-amplified sequence 1 isoform X2 n=1 Tax=Brachyhypopomus gauderio TaxID=698409 RepID=UPI004042FBE6